VNVGNVKKHCDTLKPPCDDPLSLVSFIVSLCTDSTSAFVSNAQASVFAFAFAATFAGLGGVGCPAAAAGPGEEFTTCCPGMDSLLLDGV
jgi:hypothetical protein